jgi:aminopeptidase
MNMSDIYLQKLAKLLLSYSTRVQPGEKVFITAEDVAIPWIEAVATQAFQMGAVVRTIVELDSVRLAKFRYGSREAVHAEDLFFKTIVDHADVFLTAWGSWNTKSRTNIDSEKIKMSIQANEAIRRKFSQRMGDGSLRWCGTQYPTHADAQEAGMSLEEYQDFVYRAGYLHTENPIAEWMRIEKDQEKWIGYLNSKKELHIVSEKTDLRVGIAGRTWINCCGRENFPDGEIFTSPVENQIEGLITFSFPGIYMGKEVEDISLRVSNGHVVEARAKKGEDLLRALLTTDNGAGFFGEVAIGTNYQIQQFTRNMLFDEKIGGTIHMALGDSMLEAGGTNQSSIHWDMLCDMRDQGEIYADGELFYKQGKFIEDVLG